MTSDTYLFRYGADMNPSRIRQELPTATFIARARYDQAGQDVWGIVLAVPGSPTEGAAVPVVTDDGRTLEAVFQTTDSDLADAKQVLDQVRYWEMPISYVRGWQAKVPGAEVDD